MSLSIRSFLSLMVAAFALALFASPAQAQSDADALKIEKIVTKTETKLDKTILSYEKKINSLVAKCTAKVEKMVQKGKSPEEINAHIARSIDTGMNTFAPAARAKLDATETSGLRALEKYDSPAEAEATIAAAHESSYDRVQEIWDAAGDALHALEINEE